jgi:zinc/manganese transport system permease protein
VILLAHLQATSTVTGLASLTAMLDHPFMRRALLAGVAIALLAGLVGYLMVLRAQVFAGDALSHVAFTGALAALAFGVDQRLGLFAATVGVGIVLGLLGRRGRPDDVLIGIVFAWILGLGVLALSVYTASTAAAGNAGAGVNVLFGSIFGLTRASAMASAAVAAVLAVVALAIARPLIFASVDEAVAATRGVPVSALGVAFLALVGGTAAEATQGVGALLLLGLLAAPAGAAHRLTSSPFAGLVVSATLSVISMLVGLTLSYLVTSLPPSFAIIATAAVIYTASLLFTTGVEGGRRRPGAESHDRPQPSKVGGASA